MSKGQIHLETLQSPADYMKPGIIKTIYHSYIGPGVQILQH